MLVDIDSGLCLSTHFENNEIPIDNFLFLFACVSSDRSKLEIVFEM